MKSPIKQILLLLALMMGCGVSDSVIVTLSTESDSLAVTVRNDSSVVASDTTLIVRDTIVVVRFDTVFQPVDTVVVSQVDTVVVGGDTIITVIYDTTITYDTIVFTAVDTVVRYDTVVVTDTIILPAPHLEFGVANITLDVGATRTLTVTLVNALGFPLPTPSLTWISENPAIVTVGSSSGQIRGVSPGGTRVFAFTADGISASVGVTVVAPAPPPPPPPQSGGFAANAPPGLSDVVDCDFAQTWTGGSGRLNCGLTVVDWNRSGYPNDQCRTVSDPTSIFGGRVWESHFDNGAGGSGPCLLERSLGTARDSVYVAMRVKYQSGWQANNTSQKMIYIDTDRGAGDGLFEYTYSVESVYYVTSATGCDHLESNMASVPLKSPPESPPCQNQRATVLTAGQWDVFEFLWTCTDGTVKWWKNGELRGSHTGRSIGCVNNLRFPDTWGGGGTLNQEQSRFYDRILIRASAN